MNKQTRRIVRRRFLRSFALLVFILAIIRLLFPSVAGSLYHELIEKQVNKDSLVAVRQLIDRKPNIVRVDTATGGRAHRIVGVPDYKECFPDSQAVQEMSANLHGVPPVQNRTEAEQRKNELVYIGSNPYFDLRDLTLSVPYLVPAAAILLQDIGRNFMDSLHVKGLPVCKPYVTSVMRTKDDVAKLLHRNGNATQNSCHLYGTTFDISYARFSLNNRDKWDDRNRRVLSEVLEDLREQGRCWVKYEQLQPVFHITVR